MVEKNALFVNPAEYIYLSIPAMPSQRWRCKRGHEWQGPEATVSFVIGDKSMTARVCTLCVGEDAAARYGYEEIIEGEHTETKADA